MELKQYAILWPEGRLFLTFWPLSRKLKEKFLRDLCDLSGAGGEYISTHGFCSIREKPYGKQKLVSREVPEI